MIDLRKEKKEEKKREWRSTCTCTVRRQDGKEKQDFTRQSK